MAASQRARVRWWRWRSSPLRRRIDVVEVWAVLAGWVLALAGGLFAGLMAADAVEGAIDRQRAESRRVSAVLVEEAPASAPARVAGDYRVRAEVRWTAPDGSTRTDDARVPLGTPAGKAITLWVSESGDITTEPLTEGEARLHAALGGVLAAAGTGGAVLGATWLVRLWLDRRRMAQWDAEWQRIDTRRGWKTG